MQFDPYLRFWQQLSEINRQQGKEFVAWPPEAVEGSGAAPEYVYEAGKVLCRTEHVDEVRSRLRVPTLGNEQVTGELTLVTLPAQENVPQRVREVNSGWRTTQRRASLNHLVGISPVNICPADEPVPVAVDAQPWPPRAGDGTAGEGITILVIDTGMIRDYRAGHPWLAGVREPPPGQQATFYRSGSYEPSRTTGTPLVKEYAGHGCFVSGVIGAVAPGARIRVHNALERGGALGETELGEVLLKVLDEEGWPHIINLSGGAQTQDGLPLMGLERFLAELAGHPETLLVAAAGNDAKRDDAEDRHDDLPYHFWPAAHAPHNDGVVSVGALARRHDGRACFTNYGSSVSVYARGEEHVNAFLSGEYEYRHGIDPHCHNYEHPLYCPCSCVTSLPYHGHGMFQGMARWSGTSFATPLVAGMVAVHMRETGESNARLAVRDLIDKKARTVADVDGESLLAFL